MPSVQMPRPALFLARSILPALAVAVVLGGIGLALAGCEDERDRFFSTTQDNQQKEDELKAIRKDIALLAGCKDPNDAEASAAYEAAKERLNLRGSAIENQLIEALRGNDDWGVRLGAIEVMKAVATKRCVETLIAVLDDPQPLVALNAEYLLQGLCKDDKKKEHREIPLVGQPTGANGLPPVVVDPHDLALDKEEKAWAAWHVQHKEALKKAWSEWWAKNKDKIKVE
jgi:hypothetical protein